ncbi:hypothetical protein HAZT_HAZT011671 [Hyalella azteca]|uniref:Reverse transcriptase domain-containing protein n=1 Tax=Hyalella azteca TaxID=294128 RepID=A0A6A0HFV8_HYAAZ|nr:hypothetical protein HAZT_HAZT011671 [Hyalella azteca]
MLCFGLSVAPYPDSVSTGTSFRSKPRKAAGPDKVACRLLRATAAELAPALSVLFNRSLSTGVVPAICKHALMQPVFTNGNSNQAAYYRPISLACVCCKLLEYIIRSEVTDHLDRAQQQSQRRAIWLPQEEVL